MPLSPNSPDKYVVLIVVDRDGVLVDVHYQTYDRIKAEASRVWQEAAEITPCHDEFLKDFDTYRQDQFEPPYSWHRDIARQIWSDTVYAYYPNSKEHLGGIRSAFAVIYLKFLRAWVFNSKTPFLMRQPGTRGRKGFFGLCDERWAMKYRRQVTEKLCGVTQRSVGSDI
jgi:hypothetical protein